VNKGVIPRGRRRGVVVQQRGGKPGPVRRTMLCRHVRSESWLRFPCEKPASVTYRNQLTGQLHPRCSGHRDDYEAAVRGWVAE
jgi:hypothetical protein